MPTPICKCEIKIIWGGGPHLNIRGRATFEYQIRGRATLEDQRARILTIIGMDDDVQELFAAACKQGNQKRIKELVEAGEVDPTDEAPDILDDESTFLGCACEGGDVNTIKLMIDDYGCDPNGLKHSSDLYYTPLQEACKAGRSEAVDLLVETYHCDMYREKDGKTAFDMAVENGRLDVVDLLLKTHKYDPNHRNSKGRTPLHTAAKYGNSEAVKKLIETDPEYKDNKGRTPLLIAFQCGEEGVIKALFETYKFDEGRFHVAFDFAIEYKMFNIVDLLLKTHQYDPNHRNSKGRTSLHTAAEHGSSEVMKKLIKTYKAVPECKDDEGRTPLACAVANGKRATAKLLIDEYKCNLQYTDSRGYNLLHLAAMNVKSGMAAWLITEFKFDPNVKAADGSTPLHLTKYPSIARKLIQNGADVNASNNSGHTPLYNASFISQQSKREEMVELLKLHQGENK